MEKYAEISLGSPFGTLYPLKTNKPLIISGYMWYLQLEWHVSNYSLSCSIPNS